MSSILSSQGIVLATAMAVSGTVVLLVLRLQKSPLPQSSIISSDHVKAKEKKRKKRVQFAEDVVDPTGNSEDYRKLRSNNNNSWGVADSSSENIKNRNSNCAALKKGGRVVQEMPANRVALYNGILRDRVHIPQDAQQLILAKLSQAKPSQAKPSQATWTCKSSKPL